MSRELGLSARTVRITHNALVGALQQAVKWQKLGTNPARGVDLPAERRREMLALDHQQTLAFLKAAAGSRFEVLFHVAVITGMRPGEIFGLQWKDVDWKAGAVTVQRSLSRTKGQWQFTQPKTPGSRRTIPLPAPLVRDLRQHRAAQLEERLAHGPGYQDHDLVFTVESGAPLDSHNLTNRHFKPLLKAAGLPPRVRLYDLRHGCATQMMADGVNPKVAAQRLGHASVSLTLDTYSHVLPTMQEEATEKLGKAIYGQRMAESH